MSTRANLKLYLIYVDFGESDGGRVVQYILKSEKKAKQFVEWATKVRPDVKWSYQEWTVTARIPRTVDIKEGY